VNERSCCLLSARLVAAVTSLVSPVGPHPPTLLQRRCCCCMECENGLCKGTRLTRDPSACRSSAIPFFPLHRCPPSFATAAPALNPPRPQRALAPSAATGPLRTPSALASPCARSSVAPDPRARFTVAYSSDLGWGGVRCHRC
jgi:hypothetical protein